MAFFMLLERVGLIHTKTIPIVFQNLCFIDCSNLAWVIFLRIESWNECLNYSEIEIGLWGLIRAIYIKFRVWNSLLLVMLFIRHL